MNATARGQITIVDLNDAKTVNLYLSANHPTTQIFNQDGQTYVPSWTDANVLIISPELLISGWTGNNDPTFASAPTWKINGTTVVSGTAISGFTPTIGNAASNYALTLSGNMTQTDYIKVTCEGEFYDAAMNVNIPIKADITFNKSINTGQLCMARIDATGHVFKQEATGVIPKTITLEATLVRGSESDTNNGDTTPFTVQWYHRDTNGWQEITGTVYVTGNSGTKKYEVSGRTLTVYPDGVDSEDTFRAVIKDTYTSSATYNKYFPATFTIVDLTDPFSLVITSSNGDTFKNGNVSTTLTARLQQGGVDIANNTYTVTYTWTKYNADGTQDTTWGTSGTKTGVSIAISSSDVNSRATFMCTAAIS